MRWLDYLGLVLGTVDKDGEIVEKGVSSSNEARLAANLRYFMELENSLPAWPAPLNREIVKKQTSGYHQGFGVV
jgi:hypothetical protein